MKRITIIGTGNMGGAVARSAYDAGYHITCTAHTRQTLERVKTELPDANTLLDNAEAVKEADIVVLAVKPYVIQSVINEIKDSLKAGASIVSVIAPMSTSDIYDALSADRLNLNIFKVIPNTAIRYGESVTFISSHPLAAESATEEIRQLFSLSGETFILAEKDMESCTSIASCGIAFFLRFIRAMAEGGVQLGLKPDFATRIAALTGRSAAALLKDGSHPEAEIDKVTTPGGITIRGLNALEANNFNHAVIKALLATSSGYNK